jgi:hypothetical protein
MDWIRRSVIAATVALSALFALPHPAGAIIGGSPDGSAHPYVGLIFTETGYCTATAISPTVLVTASHCMQSVPTQDFYVTFAEHPALVDGWPDPSAPGVVTGTGYELTNYCAHTACLPGLKGFATPDLAVVVLDTAVSLSQYASLPAPGVVDRLRNKARLTLVGFGVARIDRGGGQPVFVSDPQRRTVSAELLPAGPGQVTATHVKFHAKGGSSGVCFGDSGGPVLIGDTIIAVNSFLNGMCSAYDYATRVDTPDALAVIGSFL